MKLFSSLKGQATSFLGEYKQKSPATYAAAEQAVGGLLILDGLVGIDPPFASKENKRPGIFGTLLGIAVGIVFMLIPTFIGNMSGINDMTATTTAVVTYVSESSISDDSNTCSIKAKYTVDNEEYIKPSGASSSNCALSEGDKISIKYNPANPSSWSNDTGTINMFLQIFFWVGLVAVISSLVTFIIRLLSIIFGIKLLRDGRALAKTLPQGTDFSTIKNEIKQNFLKNIFNLGGTGTVMPTEIVTPESTKDKL